MTLMIGAVLAAGTGGCVGKKSASVEASETGREVALTRTLTGILLGPCANPYVGRTETGSAWLKLKGTGPIYAGSAVEIVLRDGTPDAQWSGTLTGSVDVDNAKRHVVVNLRVGGEPFPMNGTYRLKASA
jgi:hypothetical protein